MRVRALVAAKGNILTDGIKACLEKESDVELLGQFEEVSDLFDILDRYQPDVLLICQKLDVINTTNLIHQISSAYPKVNIVLISDFYDHRMILELFTAGIKGYVSPEHSSCEELVMAIRSAAMSRVYLGDSVTTAAVEHMGRVSTIVSSENGLSEREQQVLQLIAEGQSSKMIARILKIAPSTVDVHRKNIMHKTRLNNIADLTRYAIRNGIACP